MSCDEVQQELDAFVAGELLPRRVLLAVERHLEVCDSCRARADSQRRLDDLLQELPAPPVPEAFSARVLRAARRQLMEQSPRKTGSGFRRRHRILDVAAVAALALGLTVGTWMAQHTWQVLEPSAAIANVAIQTVPDIDSFYGAGSDEFDSEAQLPDAYLALVNTTSGGE